MATHSRRMDHRGRDPVNLGARSRRRSGVAETGATHALFRASEAQARLTRSNLMPTCPPRMRSLVFLLSGAALVLGVAGCRSSEDAAAATRQREAAAAVHVTTVAVVERPMPELLTLTGTLRASAESDVAADVSGKVIADLRRARPAGEEGADDRHRRRARGRARRDRRAGAVEGRPGAARARRGATASG